MTRFAWLQSRTQTLVTAGLLAALAIAAAVTGIHQSHLYDAQVAHCDPNSDCGLAINQFLSHYVFVDHALDILARAVPALVGIFWGAPLLAREFETGTYRLAWSQSVTRSRWLLTKLAVGAAATAVLAGLLTLTITWWYRARDLAGGSEPFSVFDRRDIAPVAYAVFAFALGALAGAVIRRTVPAMAASLGGFIVVRIVTSLWVRPHLMAPIRTVVSLANAGPTSNVQVGIGSSNGGAVRLFVKAPGPAKSWTLSSRLVTSAGHPVSSAQSTAFLHQHCAKALLAPAPARSGAGVSHVVGPASAQACFAQVAQSFHALVTYQPDSRYWTFQWLESGIFLALALAAAGGCYWWVTRRTR
jgi:hypothetical protein